MMTFSKTDNSLTVVVVENGKNLVYATTSSNPRWNDILSALKANDQSKVVRLMSMKSVIEEFTFNNVEIREGTIFYRGQMLHGLDTDRLLQFIRDGFDSKPLLRFLDRKMRNPSYRSIQELYKFLEHRKMPLTPEGTVLGYKGVQESMYSVMGNPATIMISGKTDDGGHIYNGVGEVVRCERSCVCDDYRQGCSPGLHIGSLEYAIGWGQRVVIVEFDPADVVSVPDDCNCQKLRACAYIVRGEYTGALPDAYTEKYSVDQPVQGTSDTDGECEEGEVEPVEKTTTDTGEDRESPYDKGYSAGWKDGKAHNSREHYDTDLDNEGMSKDEREYIGGYNAAYRLARYSN